MSGSRPADPETEDGAIGVLTVDASLTVRTWSAWLESATGIPASTARGRLLSEVVPDLDGRGLLASFSRVLETGEARVLAPAFHHYLIACPPRTPSVHFSVMQQLVTLGPLREQERVVGVIATIEDVTGRLDAERTLADELRSGDPEVRQRALARVEAAGASGPHDAIVELLGNDSWQVRRGAIDGLSRQAPDRLITSLVEALRDEHQNFNVLSSALQLLSMIAVDVTGPLAQLLKEGEPDLRIQAALALGEQSVPEAVPPLIEALNDPDPNVRFHAVESLGKLQAAEAVDALAAIAESRDFFLAFPAIDALARIDDPRVAARLRPLLEDEALSAPVADALGRLGDGDATRALVAVLNRPRPPVASITSAIAYLYDAYERRYAAGDYIVSEFRAALDATGAQNLLDTLGEAQELRSLVLVLGWVQSPAVARALTQLLGRPDARVDVIEALVRHGPAVVDVLIDQLDTNDEQVQLAAVSALGKLGDHRAGVPLTRLLQRDCPFVLAVIDALATIGAPSAFRPLLGLLAHSDATIRQAAVSALNSLGHPETEACVAPLLEDADAHVRESAVRIAGYFGYPSCIEALFERCQDEDEVVRRVALEHVAFANESRALSVLLRAVSDDTPRARGAAATALGRITHADARAALRRALADNDPWVRYFAARALAEQRAEEALADLGAAASSDPTPFVRIAALEAIGVIDGPRAADLLATHADDPAAEIASAALRSLGRVADASVDGILTHALRSTDQVRRLSAVTAFSMRGGAGAVAALRWAAEADASAEVGAAAMDGLARLAVGASDGWAEAIDALVELTANSSRRDDAMAGLARTPAERIERVERGLTHPADRVRRQTIDALIRIKHPEASARVRAALDDPDAVVRESAVTALHRIGARGVSAKLASMAAADPDAAVRCAAATALAGRRDVEGGGGAGG